MKKFIAIALSVLILLGSTELSMAIHYCPMAKKTTISFSEVKSCCAGNEMPGKCCKNTQLVVKKVEDSFKSAENIQTPQPQTTAFLLAWVNAILPSFNQSAFAPNLFVEHAPPDSPPVTFPILYRSILV